MGLRSQEGALGSWGRVLSQGWRTFRNAADRWLAVPGGPDEGGEHSAGHVVGVPSLGWASAGMGRQSPRTEWCQVSAF